MTDSYNQEKAIAMQLSGETSSSLPYRNNIETLHALKSLRPNDAGIEAMVAEELRWLSASADALNKNQYLQMQFGSGLEGAAKLAPLLRQEQAMESTRELIKPFLPAQRPWVASAKKGGINWNTSAPSSNP